MLAQDAAYDGQPQPPTGRYGGKTWLEDPGDDFVTHSGTAVRDLDHHVVARRQRLLANSALQRTVVEHTHPCLQSNRPVRATNRLRGIDDQAHDDLLELGRSAGDRGQPWS